MDWRGMRWTRIVLLASVLIVLGGCATTASGPTRPAGVATTTGSATSTVGQPQAVASSTATTLRQATTTPAQATQATSIRMPSAAATPVLPRVSPAAVLSGHTGPVTVLAWSPDGTRFATSSGVPDPTDHTVRV